MQEGATDCPGLTTKVLGECSMSPPCSKPSITLSLHFIIHGSFSHFEQHEQAE